MLATLNPQLSAAPIGTAFTYQGRLTDGGQPANGSYDLQFTLYDSPAGSIVAGGPITTNAVAVSNGLFTVTLDFGSAVFVGDARWLAIGVRPGGTTDDLIPLSPRQLLTPTPYAITAENVTGTLPSAYTNAVSFNNPANGFVGSHAGNGAGLSNVNAATVGGVAPAAFWQLGGNAGTTPGTQFLGTTDNQPLEFKLNNERAFRLEPAKFSPNVMGGSPQNTVGKGLSGAVISGGGSAALPNRVVSDFASVLGGAGNSAESWGATAMGGQATASGPCSTAMGTNTLASGFAALAMGEETKATNEAATAIGYNTAAGGLSSTAMGAMTVATGDSSTALGALTTASGMCATALGYNSIARNNYTLAAGTYALATNQGARVFADYGTSTFGSANTNEFAVRATGGVRFVTALTGGNPSAGVSLAPGASSWATLSDRNAKKNFAAVDGEEVLNKLATVPIQEWDYHWEADDATPHLGPVAQDFKAAFYPGRDDKSITTLEYDGVALAAFQGLNAKVEDRSQKAENSIQKIAAKNAALEKEVAELKALVQTLAENVHGGGQ